jgi:hypothetical protein
LALFAYAGAFDITDGKFALVFFVVPAAQAIFPVAALIVAYFARKRAEVL